MVTYQCYKFRGPKFKSGSWRFFFSQFLCLHGFICVTQRTIVIIVLRWKSHACKTKANGTWPNQIFSRAWRKHFHRSFSFERTCRSYSHTQTNLLIFCSCKNLKTTKRTQNYYCEDHNNRERVISGWFMVRHVRIHHVRAVGEQIFWINYAMGVDGSPPAVVQEFYLCGRVTVMKKHPNSV